MAEIEDVAGFAGGLFQDLFDALFDEGLGGKEGDGVKVALEGGTGAQGGAGGGDGGAPVKAEDVCAGGLHDGEQGGGVDAEVDDGDTHVADVLYQEFRRGEAELFVIGEGEVAGPGVEDLDDVGSGFDLLAGVGGEDGDEFFHQQEPGAGVGEGGGGVGGGGGRGRGLRYLCRFERGRWLKGLNFRGVGKALGILRLRSPMRPANSAQDDGFHFWRGS